MKNFNKPIVLRKMVKRIPNKSFDIDKRSIKLLNKKTMGKKHKLLAKTLQDFETQYHPGKVKLSKVEDYIKEHNDTKKPKKKLLLENIIVKNY